MRKRIIVIVAAIVTIIAIIFIFTNNSIHLEIPKTILQLRIIEEISGQKAKLLVDELHKKEVTPKGNIIGKYQSNNGNATLYLSAYSSHQDALKQCDIMVFKIKENNAVFTHFREINIQGTNVNLCLGMNQAHYFYVSGSNLYWFTVDMPIAQASIRELLRLTKSAL